MYEDAHLESAYEERWHDETDNDELDYWGAWSDEDEDEDEDETE